MYAGDCGSELGQKSMLVCMLQNLYVMGHPGTVYCILHTTYWDILNNLLGMGLLSEDD